MNANGQISGIPLQLALMKVYTVKAERACRVFKCEIAFSIERPIHSLPPEDPCHVDLMPTLSESQSTETQITIDGYMIEHKLKSGGQGTVWLGRTRGFQGSRVTIKVCRHDYEVREVENLVAIAKLNHPNLVRFIDFVEEKSALVMEYIDGICLKDKLKLEGGGQQKLPWVRANVIMRGMLSGLACLHTMDRVMSHRDIKPDNIMIAKTPRGSLDADNIVLVDFGLSKRANAGQTMTYGERFIGSPHYFSPEQVSSDGRLDVRVDVWAAGIVMYEMLGGKRPFRSKIESQCVEENSFDQSMMSLFESIKNDSMTRIPTAGLGVNIFMERALQKKRRDRFSDVKEMLETFEALCKDPDTVPDQLMRPQKPSVLDRPEKPRIVGFFAKKITDKAELKRNVLSLQKSLTDQNEFAAQFATLLDDNVEVLNIHKEAERLMLGFTHPRSLFEVDVYAQPTFRHFQEVMLSAAYKNVRVLHLGGHGDNIVGFFWLEESLKEYAQISMDSIAELFETETAQSQIKGTVECVVLNACNTESLGRKLRAIGIPHVI